MRIGLVDIDGHHFPNLALMKLSTWHKSQGDSVEFADPMFGRYDRVYMSKVFTFTPDCPDIYHCEVIRGGTGFRDYTTVLPGEIEHICPDYSLYGVNEAYGFLTRGCPNRCPWCIVPHKEGAIRPASPLREFIGDKRRAVLLDNNVLASDFGLEQIEEIIRMGIAVDFNQGLDARRTCDDPYILDLLARAKWIQHIRFACDRMSQLEAVTKCVKELGRRGIKPYRIFVYCLIQDVDESLERINALRKLKVARLPSLTGISIITLSRRRSKNGWRVGVTIRLFSRVLNSKTTNYERPSNEHRAVEAADRSGSARGEGEHGMDCNREKYLQSQDMEN